MGIETAVVGILAKAGVAASVAKFAFGVAKFLAITAATSALAKRGLKGSPDLQARTLTSRGTIDPQKIIYGETLVAGTLAYRNALGLKNRELWSVHALAGHECDAITDCHLDDKVITNAQINSGNVAGGPVLAGDFDQVRGQNVVEIYKHYGTSSQGANSQLVAAASEWTSSHRLRGITYAITKFVLFDKTEKLWEAGDPANVKFLVRGKKVYDPRLDSTRIIDSTTSPVTLGSGTHRVDDDTTWAWSDNPALCTADYLIDAKFSPLANGVDPDRVDYESVAKTADKCDTLVFIPPAASPQNTQKRFTCNGVLYGTDTPEENLNRLLSSFQGELTFSGGIYGLQTGYESPSETLSEGDIVGAIGVRSALDEEQRLNTLKAIYIDPDKRYEPTETAPIELYKDTRDKGDELIDTVTLDMTNNWYMAQRICQLRLQEANEELILSVPCNLRAARYVPGQRVNLTVTERGWTPKIFKVLSWEFFDRGGDQIGVNLDLREDSAAAYSDPEVGEYNTVDGNGTIIFGDPEPIPSVDTIPPGVNYGVGSTNVIFTKNQQSDGTADDGEIRAQAGTYWLPNGNRRVLSSDADLLTPYEGSTQPPDTTAYIVWGASNPAARFPSSPEYTFGDSAAQAAGLFVAIRDRFNDQWYAVTNGNVEVAFTPADTDYIMARLIKTSASGGIDSLTELVSFRARTELYNLMPFGYADLENLTINDLLVFPATGSSSPMEQPATVTIDNTLAFLGTQSLKMAWPASQRNDNPDTVYFASDSVKANIKVVPGRRYVVVAQFYPANADSLNLKMQFVFAGAVSAAFNMSSMNAGQWNQLAVEVDASLDTITATQLVLVANYPTTEAIPSLAPAFNIDTVMVFDITDNDDVVADL